MSSSSYLFRLVALQACGYALIYMVLMVPERDQLAPLLLGMNLRSLAAYLAAAVIMWAFNALPLAWNFSNSLLDRAWPKY